MLYVTKVIELKAKQRYQCAYSSMELYSVGADLVSTN
jgi:hypothetical protein